MSFGRLPSDTEHELTGLTVMKVLKCSLMTRVREKSGKARLGQTQEVPFLIISIEQ